MRPEGHPLPASDVGEGRETPRIESPWKTFQPYQSAFFRWRSGQGEFIDYKFCRGHISREKNLVGFQKKGQKIWWEFLVMTLVYQNI